MFFCCFWVNADNDSQNIEVEIHSTSVRHGRSYEHIPVECYYDDGTKCIIINFMQNIGIVEISVYHVESINCYYDCIDSVSKQLIMPILGEVGDYHILIQTEKKGNYEGRFEIL